MFSICFIPIILLCHLSWPTAEFPLPWIINCISKVVLFLKFFGESHEVTWMTRCTTNMLVKSRNAVWERACCVLNQHDTMHICYERPCHSKPVARFGWPDFSTFKQNVNIYHNITCTPVCVNILAIIKIMLRSHGFDLDLVLHIVDTASHILGKTASALKSYTRITYFGWILHIEKIGIFWIDSAL